MKLAFKVKPKVGGFPYLAEALRASGVVKNIWSLPSCQSVYLMTQGNVVSQGTPLITGITEIPQFNRDALIRALRVDQAGDSTFSEFLMACWKAGIVQYDVDFEKRYVTYYGAIGQSYTEEYLAVDLEK